MQGGLRGRLLAVFAIGTAALILALAWSVIFVSRSTEPSWTPLPVTRLSPTQWTSPTSAPTTPLPHPSATRLPAVPTPGATGGESNLMVITQEDVVRVLSNPSLYPEGLEVAGLDVKFSGGKMYVTADSVNYGMFRLRNLSLVGHLVAEDGQLQIEVESMSPMGLAGAMIPRLANDAMGQLGGRWYVEDVQVDEGQVSVRFR